MSDPALPSPLQRASWQDAFFHCPPATGVSADDARRRMSELDDLLFGYWRLGERVVVLWTSTGRSLSVIGFEYFALAEYVSGVRTVIGGATTPQYVDALVSGQKRTQAERFIRIARELGVFPVTFELSFDPVTELGADLVEALLRRYSVSLFRNRAVVLLDIVGFSTYEPIEQVTLLNSLSYSINSAYDKLAAFSADAQFARSPTGDGFYIWNRAANAQANVELYKLMLLLLADNAIARSKARTRAVPELRSGFHVGAHYEFYQADGLSPTLASYLVGQVTIDLARMLEQAMPGQILIGDFPAVEEAGTPHGEGVPLAPDFVERMQLELHRLAGIRLAGDEVTDIRCYLTGPRQADGSYGVTRYGTLDKHGALRRTFNAKINIHRRDAAPIYLGIRDRDVRGFHVDPGGT